MFKVKSIHLYGWFSCQIMFNKYLLMLVFSISFQFGISRTYDFLYFIWNASNYYRYLLVKYIELIFTTFHPHCCCHADLQKVCYCWACLIYSYHTNLNVQNFICFIVDLCSYWRIPFMFKYKIVLIGTLSQLL